MNKIKAQRWICLFAVQEAQGVNLKKEDLKMDKELLTIKCDLFND